MAKHEVPHDQWIHFCDDYSRQHEGWLTTVEVHDRKSKDRVEARSVPFRGVSYETKGTDKDELAIFLSQGTDADETHVIDHPTHIRFESESGTDRGLEVDAKDGTTTIIRFEHPMPPGMINQM